MKFPSFMEPENSSPCSQNRTVRLYPEPHESSLYLNSMFLQI